MVFITNLLPDFTLISHKRQQILRTKKGGCQTSFVIIILFIYFIEITNPGSKYPA